MSGKLTELEDLPELEMTGFDAKTLDVLRFEPLEDDAEDETETGDLTLTLEMNEETYRQLAPRLDALVAEFDLACHVRRNE